MRRDEWGDLACEAGRTTEPVGCERHGRHYWCPTCEGWYGVPHLEIHQDEPSSWSHPAYGSKDCACRPCKLYQQYVDQDHAPAVLGLDDSSHEVFWQLYYEDRIEFMRSIRTAQALQALAVAG